MDGLTAHTEGVPESFVAGGGWGGFSVVVTNASGQPRGGHDIQLTLNVVDEGDLIPGRDVRAQFFAGGVWREAPLVSDPDLGDLDMVLPGALFDFPAARTDVPVRLAFTDKAPLINFFVTATMIGDHSLSEWTASKIVAPEGGEEPGGEEPGGEEPGGEEPGVEEPGAERPGGETGDGQESGGVGAPDPGAVPPGAGTGGGGMPMGGQSGDRTGGRLAETGADAAATWTLGAAGTALALGSSLIVGVTRSRPKGNRAAS
ncbi:hypothetical protein ABZZ17_30555 [Streptomyces sp. NPDC006512]|uniref:hypothetical protein n=1 Tax=Streptomyces sp. NPDC006512 TaxID=3154307 RepID=UPI0033B7CCE8